MLRRGFLALGSSSLALAGARRPIDACGCALAPPPAGSDAFSGLHSGVKITGLKVFGVSLTRESDRPYVFVKIETNQGVVGWGEGTLEGKSQLGHGVRKRLPRFPD
jgi:galactonate dehydratase